MRALLPILANQALAVLLGLAGLKLLTAFVPPEINGSYALFLTFTQFGTLVTHSGLLNHAMRFWQREQASGSHYLAYLTRAGWRGMVPLGCLLAIASFYQFVQTGDLSWVLLLPALALGTIGAAFGSVGNGLLMAAQRHWAVLGWSCLGNVTRTLVPLGLAIGLGVTFPSLAWGFACHGLIFLVAWWWLFQRRQMPAAPQVTHSRDWSRELKEYGRPFILMGIGGWFLQFGDKWIVLHFFGKEQVGYLDNAIKLGGIIPVLVAGALMQWAFPKVFRKADLSDNVFGWLQVKRRCDQVTVVYFILATAGALATHWIAPFLVPTIISEQYLPALPMIVAAGFITINAAINQFYYLILQAQHNSGDMVKVMLFMAVLKMGGGLVAAAISWTVFLIWLPCSVVASWILGRWLIKHFVMRNNGQIVAGFQVSE